MHNCMFLIQEFIEFQFLCFNLFVVMLTILDVIKYLKLIVHVINMRFS